jgi:hypothetical protein
MTNDHEDEQTKKRRLPPSSEHQRAAEKQAQDFIDETLRARTVAASQQDKAAENNLKDLIEREIVARDLISRVALVQAEPDSSRQSHNDAEMSHGRVRFLDGSSVPIHKTPEQFARAHAFAYLGGSDNIATNPNIIYGIESADRAKMQDRNSDRDPSQDFHTRLSWGRGGKGQTVLLRHHPEAVEAVLEKRAPLDQEQGPHRPSPARYYDELRATHHRVGDDPPWAKPTPRLGDDIDQADTRSRQQDQQHKDTQRQEALRERGNDTPAEKSHDVSVELAYQQRRKELRDRYASPEAVVDLGARHQQSRGGGRSR